MRVHSVTSGCQILGILLMLVVVPSLAAAPPKRLTCDGRLKMDPVFVKQGKELVFCSQKKFNQLILMQLKMKDLKVARLHSSAITSEFSPSFAKDESRYAYIRNDGNLHVQLVMRNQKSGKDQRHNPGGGFAGVRSISINPNGKRVVFAFPEKGLEQQIFSVDFSGKNRKALTIGNGFNAYPKFSPNGQSIAFVSTRTGNFDVFIMNSDGKSASQLTDHRGLDTRPAWSPDGKTIAYTSLRKGNYDIYLMKLNGGKPIRLTRHPERDDYCCWHPNGRQIVVVGERKGSHDLYLYDVSK